MKYKFDDIAFNSTTKKKPVDSDKHTYIGLEHLDSGCFTISRWGAESAPEGDKLLIKKGDVLFGKRRAYQRKVGIAPFDGIFSAHGMVLRAKEDVIDKDFFPFFIASDQFMETAVRISVGGLSPTINWRDLREQEFELPSLEQQHQIAKKLWAAYNLREAYKRLCKQIDETVKSQFIEMFKDENRFVALTDICRPKQWKTLSTKELTKSGYLTYGANGLIGYYSSFNHEHPTIMIGCRGTCGAVNISKPQSYINGNAMALDNLSSDLALKYLAYYLSEYDFNPIISGGVQPQITGKGLTKVQVKVPCIEKQNIFVSIVEQADKSKFGNGFKSQFIEMLNSNGYSEIPLGQLCKKITDGSHNPPKGIDISEYIMISSKNVYKDGLDLSDVRYLSKEEFEIEDKRTRCSKGDVLLTIVGTIGRAYLIRGDEGNIVMQRSVAVLSPNEKIMPQFLTYSLHIDEELEKEGRGNAQKGVYLKELAKYKIKVPSITIQRGFEAILNQADKSKSVCRQAIKRLAS